MYILGISCFYHESAACLIKDGVVVAASAEERFSRKKHDNAYPEGAVAFCLRQAGIKTKELSYIVFYEKPFLKFHRILMSVFATYPWSLGLFTHAMTSWFSEKLWVRSILMDKLDVGSGKILFTAHHLSHAAASFYPSGFTKAAILTVDGAGEWSTTAFGVGAGNTITLTKEQRFPHSLGLLYSAFTAFLGFEVNDGEYKVMGMASYGKPKYVSQVKKLIDIYPDGSFSLHMDYFTFHRSADIAYGNKFTDLFGPPRPCDMHFFTRRSRYPAYFGPKPSNYPELCRRNQRYADIAASIQAVTEEMLIGMANTLYKETKLDNLVIGGGVALNSVANTAILQKTPFKRLFVQPAAGDDGGAFGAALYVYHALLGNKRTWRQNTAYFGDKFTDDQIVSTLKKHHISFTKIESERRLVSYIVDALTADKVIGFFHGSAEWGPRALGARSILASPRNGKMKDIVNVRIKFREPYRPFAPVVLASKIKIYFDTGRKDYTNLANFMLGVFPVRKEMRRVIPAVTHVDGSARPQIITRKQNALYFDIVKRFGDKTGVYVLLNTSFNLRGEPIVNSPEDAIATFIGSGLDLLIIEHYVVRKEDIPPSAL